MKLDNAQLESEIDTGIDALIAGNGDGGGNDDSSGEGTLDNGSGASTQLADSTGKVGSGNSDNLSNKGNDKGNDKGGSNEDGKGTDGEGTGSNSGNSDNGESDNGNDTKKPVSDELLSRAVRAGMPLSDAKGFSDPAALERTCGLLEKVSQGSQSSEKKNDDDSLSEIPDLDPEEYDEGIVKGFAAMKKLILAQNQTIQELRKGSGPAESSFDKQVNVLSDAYTDTLGKQTPTAEQQQKRQELRSVYDALAAGYKAQGKEVGDAEIFNQAVSATLGHIAQKAAQDKLSGQLGKREERHTARPGGKKVNPKGDVFNDIAQEIDNKFFTK